MFGRLQWEPLGNSRCDDDDYNYYFLKRHNPKTNVKPKANSGCNTLRVDTTRSLSSIEMIFLG